MARSATIVKARLHIADMDRGYYQSHAFTLAQHPSETDERLAVRLLAFAANASDTLAFSSDLSGEDHEPELSERSLIGDIETWIAFGTPDEKWLRKAANRAGKVLLYAYGDRSVKVWWEQQEQALQRYRNLSVYQFMDEQLAAVAGQIGRSIDWQCNISDGQLMLTSGDDTMVIEPVVLKA